MMVVVMVLVVVRMMVVIVTMMRWFVISWRSLACSMPPKLVAILR